MSAILVINGSVKGTVQGLLPEAGYYTGTPDMQARESSGKANDVSVTLDSYIINGTPNGNTVSTTLLIGFWLPDSFESNSVQQDNIVVSADIISDKFLEAYLENTDIEVKSFKKAPSYKQGPETWSGVMLELQIEVAACSDYVFPDLDEYVQNISKDISPLDWQGVSYEP